MSQVFANPDDLERFAQELNGYIASLRERTAFLRGQFNNLSSVWRDQEHQKFAQEFQQTIRVLDNFVRSADQQVPFLQQKAARLRGYLNNQDQISNLPNTVVNISGISAPSVEQRLSAGDQSHSSNAEGLESVASSPYLDNTRVKLADLKVLVEKLAQIEWLTAAQWRNLDIHQKVVALNLAGKALGEVYRIPAPPLLVQRWEDRYAFGAYGDGYSFNARTGMVEGADYQIAMNALAETDCKRLFGENPAAALETYAHEFRHAWQAEQVLCSQKPQFRNLVDDLDAAEEWQHEYVSPEADYEAYYNQPVEKDARDFAAAVVLRLYKTDI